MKLRCFTFLVAVLVLAATGCASRVSVSACAVDCYVYDTISRQAIANAGVYVIYCGNRGEKFERGPFQTDKEGMVRVSERSNELSVPFGEQRKWAYYRRGLEVRVDGYRTERVLEHMAKSDPKTASPLELAEPLDEMGPFIFYLDRIVPNQSLDPSSLSVTSPAGQEPRQT